MKKVFRHNDFTATVTDEGGYFSITGECGGSSGAVGDSIAKIFPGLALVNALHLSNCETGEPMHAWANGKYWAEKGDTQTLRDHLRCTLDEARNFMALVSGKATTNYSMKKLLGVLSIRWENEAKQVYQIVNDTPADLTENVEGVDLDDFDEPDKVRALAGFMECHHSQVEEEGRNEFTVQGQRYLVVTDEEADELWDEDLENYIDDCILPDVPEPTQSYFDREAWKRDAKMDGRGHSLGRYDGCENEETIDDVTYYIYQV